MKKILVLLSLVFVSVALVACDTNDNIVVGNTAATSGGFAGVGVPFNALMNVVFDDYNARGGFDGRKIEFKHYDDKFDAALGKEFTEKLVEEDKVFAITGHFGTPTVTSTIKYLKDNNVPMVYAATGVNALYSTGEVGNPIMPVQPIYRTDGQIIVARLLKEKLYGLEKNEAFPEKGKIGVLHSAAEDGKSLLEGIKEEATKLGVLNDLVTREVAVDNIPAAYQALKAAGVSAIVVASNQVIFGAAINALNEDGNKVPVFTSYVNADIQYITGTTYDFDIYSSAWLDVFTVDGQIAATKYATLINDSSLSDAEKASYTVNSFAIAGYVAATVFLEGLDRVQKDKLELTRKNYITAMESAPISIPMGGVINFGAGNRTGIDQLSLLKYTYIPAVGEAAAIKMFIKAREIESLEEIEKK